MNIEEIVYEFSYVKNLKFPKEALDAAIEMQDEITPVLLDAIKITPPELLSIYEAEKGKDTQNMMWEFSLHLLAQFRCKEAFEPIIEFFTYHDSDVVDATADMLITETLPGLLAATFNGDVERLFELMSRDGLDVFIRKAFFKSSVILYKYGELDKKPTFAHYKKMYNHYKAHHAEMITYWVSDIAKLAEPEFRADIDQAYEDKLVDLFHIGPKGIDRYYRSPLVVGDSHFSKLDDAYEEMKWWSWFTYRYEPEPNLQESIIDDLIAPNVDELNERMVSITHPKIGRNEKCFCGSGKKYKKCCLYENKS